MYQLPPSTFINKPLHKKDVFEKFNLKKSDRDRFDADISRMTLVARISTATVPALKEGINNTVFYVLQVILKQKEYNVQNVLLLQKLIRQKIVFALQYKEDIQLCIFHTRLQQSEWRAEKDTFIPLQGLSLDDAWNNIVTFIGNLDATSEESIEEQIINREEREKLLRLIDAQEKQCRMEKQKRKKYELHQQIVELKKQIDK